MKCPKARIYIPDLASNQLQGPEKELLERHLDDCPSCTAILDTSRKLQSLLSLKRHERPQAEFSKNFLPDFHHRLYSEMAQTQLRSRASLWEKIRSLFSFEVDLTFVAQTAAAALVLGLFANYILFSSGTPKRSSDSASVQQDTPAGSVVEVESRFNELVLTGEGPGRRSIYVLDRVGYKPSHNGSVVIHF